MCASKNSNTPAPITHLTLPDGTHFPVPNPGTINKWASATASGLITIPETVSGTGASPASEIESVATLVSTISWHDYKTKKKLGMVAAAVAGVEAFMATVPWSRFAQTGANPGTNPSAGADSGADADPGLVAYLTLIHVLDLLHTHVQTFFPFGAGPEHDPAVRALVDAYLDHTAAQSPFPVGVGAGAGAGSGPDGSGSGSGSGSGLGSGSGSGGEEREVRVRDRVYRFADAKANFTGTVRICRWADRQLRLVKGPAAGFVASGGVDGCSGGQ